MDEERLKEKLLLIEAMCAGATTEGERSAAASAAERVRRRLEQVTATDPPVEYRFSVADRWSRRLLLVLLRRYGIGPYRYRSQRRATIMARVSRRFVDETLWPEFVELSRTLQAHLHEVTERVIGEAIGPDRGDEEVRPDVAALGDGAAGGIRAGRGITACRRARAPGFFFGRDHDGGIRFREPAPKGSTIPIRGSVIEGLLDEAGRRFTGRALWM